MKFQGDIASIPISDVMQNLAANRKSGVLTLHLGDQTRQITFKDGRINSYVDDSGFSAVVWFEEKQLIPRKEYAKVIRRYKKARRKGLGAILEDAGAMPAEDFAKHLRILVHDMLCETLSFRQGTFEFADGATPPEAVNREMIDSGVELPVNAVLMDAARRMDEWVSIRNSLPPENDIYQIPPSERESLLREHVDNEVLSEAIRHLDGSLSIREVIAHMQTPRFDASRAIAKLVSTQKARPVDGTDLVAQFDPGASPADRTRALVRLKAALEREPGNVALLQKVAELCLLEGKPEEAAVYHKLLAQQLRQSDDLSGAERELRRSLQLNSKDIGTWQKLYDLLDEEENVEELLAFGTDFAKNLRGMGLDELARDHLRRMIGKFPGADRLRFEYADSLFALGDRNGAVEHLLELAREQLNRGKEKNAEQTLAKVITYDNHHKQAREIFEKIKTGELVRNRQRRRRLVRAAAAAAVAATLCFFVGYDYFVRREFAFAVRQVFADQLIENGKYQEAAMRLDIVRKRHPFSLLYFVEAKEFVETLLQGARNQSNNGLGPNGTEPPGEQDG